MFVLLASTANWAIFISLLKPNPYLLPLGLLLNWLQMLINFISEVFAFCHHLSKSILRSLFILAKSLDVFAHVAHSGIFEWKLSVRFIGLVLNYEFVGLEFVF